MRPHTTEHPSPRRPDREERRAPKRLAFRRSLTAVLALLIAGQCVFAARTLAVERDPAPDSAITADLRSPYGAVVVALTGDRPEVAIRILPDSFARHLHYRPRLSAGRPVNPRGDCSSPVPLPRRFTDLCRTHDFGYDILRAAAADGRPLGGWARRALDQMLVEQMYASCTNPFCGAAAAAADLGLSWNTWRQRSGVPVPRETSWQLVTTTAQRALIDPLIGVGA
ncbi:hypothetical protein QSJ18_02475 [Gordonia sp. ABSL1-1]|uniref:hypothetical protein n=1 Tax=Gordonia sp. ABSL1-1 TaxID=3053923 RepID=UPI002573C0FF|nr:hypothetical protein [Gordonia sp. ABSL1-1]MDL9935601.1 hypothetical protein [Gordonia sp. ABSL1-1]